MVDAFFQDFGGGALSSTQSCGCVDELQFQLRTVLESKLSPTRAEHVAIAFELRGTSEFTLNLIKSNNNSLESPRNADPKLGGLRIATGEVANEQAPKIIKAIDTLVNQPQDDPAAQRVVAKHIVNAISAVDSSNWAVREVSRGAQGWIFTYNCEDSFQAWNRQNGKNPARPTIGEFSTKIEDPINLSKLHDLANMKPALIPIP
jgi:hypothetical protein